MSWDTFERFRQKGLDARRAGQWDAAKLYLLEASRTMVALAKDAQGESLKDGREQIARRLLELARDCDNARRENRRQPSMSPRRNGSGDVFPSNAGRKLWLSCPGPAGSVSPRRDATVASTSFSATI